MGRHCIGLREKWNWFFVSRLWIIIVVRTEGMWTWVGMKGCELNWSLCSVCRTEFVAKGELVGCEELTRLLQKT